MFTNKSVIFIFAAMAAGCAAPTVPPHPAKTEPPPVQVSTRTNSWTEDWTDLFDGKTLANWAATDFAGHGDVTVASGQINIGTGVELSGINWTNGTLPRSDYEISLEAMKVDGSDFFCGLTFPVEKSSCSLILGGWGGGVVGLSSLDGMDASENETSQIFSFENKRWYHVRVQVTPRKITAWLDDKKIIDVKIAGREVALRPGSIFLSEPLGVAAYQTSAVLRNFKLKLIHE